MVGWKGEKTTENEQNTWWISSCNTLTSTVTSIRDAVQPFLLPPPLCQPSFFFLELSRHIARREKEKLDSHSGTYVAWTVGSLDVVRMCIDIHMRVHSPVWMRENNRRVNYSPNIVKRLNSNARNITTVIMISSIQSLPHLDNRWHLHLVVSCLNYLNMKWRIETNDRMTW